MPVDIQLNSIDRSGNRKEFVRNWVAGAGDSRSIRRRLMAILRMAHMALGIGRRRLGLGSLGMRAGRVSVGSLRVASAVTGSVASLALLLPATAFFSLASFSSALAGTCVQLDAQTAGPSAGGTGSSNPVQCGNFSIAIGAGSGANAQNFGVAVGDAANSTGLNSVAIGRQSTATGESSSVLGQGSRATAINTTAVGTIASATGAGSSAYGAGSIASGTNTVAIGGRGASLLSAANSTTATADGAIAIGVNGTRGAQANSINSIAIGGESTAGGEGASALGLSSTAVDDYSTALGHQTNAQGIASTALGSGAITDGDGATAVGNNASAQGVSSFAGGRNALAQGENSIAIGGSDTAGTGASAAGVSSIAMGANASAVTDGAIAIGQDSSAQGGQAVAIGVGQMATGDGAVAIGDPNVVNGTGSVAIGANNFVAGNPGGTASATGAVAIGNSNTAIGDGSVALGNNAYAGSPGNVGVAIGENTRSVWGVAIGEGATTSDIQYGVSIGNNTSTALRGVAIGYRAQSSGDGAVAIGGIGTSAEANGSVALGEGSMGLREGLNGATELFSGTAVASMRGAVSIGSEGNERQITNVAGGTQATDAVNVRQLQAVADDVAAVDDRAVKYDGAVGDPKDTITLEGASGTTITNVAPGELSATSTDAVNGSQLFATNEQVDQNTTEITNLGDTITNIAGDTSTTYVEANGSGIRYVRTNETGLTTSDSSAQGQGSTAVGYDATAVGVGALALGQNAQANEDGSVALGAGSVTAAAVGTTNIDINGTTYTFAGTSPASTVSVGAVGAERTITNVAAGQVTGTSTDAINGSQLFATNQAIEDLSANVEASATHYYSVNDGGTNGGNYNNDGATGLNSLAAGVGATASGVNSVATGNGVTASGLSTVAIGDSATAGGDYTVAVGWLAGNNHAPDARNTFLGGSAGFFGSGEGNTYVGYSAGGNSNGNNNVGLGSSAGALVDGSDNAAIGIGAGASVTGNRNIAFGSAAGQVVNADDTISIGSGAFANADNALALGAGATSQFEGSVALGSGSVTDAAVGSTDIDINGTTYAFAGTSPTSTVSVGNVGAERTISNVAAGRISATSTDAINGSQLFATNQAVEAIDDDVAELGDRAVKYDGALGDPKDTITLEGTAGTTITNLADGDISATSTDAVNGSQLFATNQQVDQNTTDITNLGDTITNIAGDTSTTYTEANGVGIRYARTNETGLAQTDAFAQGVGSTAVGYQATASAESALALGRDAQADVLGGVALGAGSIADRAIAPSTGTIPAGSAVITYNTTDQELLGAVSVGRDGAYRQITNVADGTDAQDAVTIRQLQGAIASVGVTATHYFHANSAAPDSLAIGTDSIAVGPSTVVNGDNGIGMGNGSIVDATAPGGTAIGQDAHVMMADGIALGTSSQAGGEQAIAIGAGAVADHYLGVALGSGSMTAAAVGTSEIVINGQTYAFAGATPESVVSIGAVGAERQLINVAAGRVTADSTDAINGSQLFATNQAVEAIDDNVAELDDRAVKYDGALGDPKDTITLEGTTGTRITNLAAGAVNSTSTDAINGSQLYGVSNSIANHLGGGATVNPDGTVNGPTYVMQGGNYTTVYDTFAAVDTSLTNINNTITDINNGGGIKYFHANSAAADSQAIGQESVAVGPQAVANADNSVAMGNGATTVAGADGAVALGQGATANNAGDVALGSGSTTQAVVNTSGTTINGTDYAFAGTNATSTVSVGGVGSERTITNVAAGRVTADSTDAINGSQLYATNQAIDDLASGIGDLQDGAVMYDKNPDGSRANSVTLIGGDPNAPVLLSNVADGVANNDAVNVGQLKEGLSNTLIDANSYTDNRVSYAIDTANSYTDQVAVTTLNQANNYTDYKFGQLNQEIGEVRNEARQAAAIGLAAASLRYDDRPGKASVAVGGGVWRGQGAFAFGAGYTSENGRVRANLSATTAGGKWGAGAGISFTLN